MPNKKSTEDILVDSFMDIAKSKPIEKITVKEITDRANVIRATFYNHFQDKYEILEWVIKDKLLGSVDVLIENGMIHEAIIVVGRNILHNKEFFKNAVKLTGQNSFEMIVEKCISDTFLEFFFKNPNGHNARNPWITPERIAGYFAHSLTYIFIMWIKADMAVSPEDMAEIYAYIEDKSLLETVREMGVNPLLTGQEIEITLV